MILITTLPLLPITFKRGGKFSLMKSSSQSSKSRITGGDMNGSIVRVVTFMVSFGWKMHHQWMHLTEIIQILLQPSYNFGINVSQHGILIKIVLLLLYILLPKCSTLCRIQKRSWQKYKTVFNTIKNVLLEKV